MFADPSKWSKYLYMIIILLYSEWSNAGITVNGTNDTYIQCVSSHLTSFAVLVASGEVHI